MKSFLERDLGGGGLPLGHEICALFLFFFLSFFGPLLLGADLEEKATLRCTCL